MNRSIHILLAAAALPVAALAQSLPYLPEQLQLRVTLEFAVDAGLSRNSVFNSRFFDGYIYANQINAGTMGFGRYPSGSPQADLVVNNTTDAKEHRTIAPFRGARSHKYLLGSSGAAGPTTTFSRYDFDGANRVDVPAPDGQTVEGFDWVDDHTIVYTVYNPSANRKRLGLATVAAEPFAVTASTKWNASGYITTSVTTRIRNIRVGDVHSGYAYYGDAGQLTDPNFYALNLATGEETLLGNAGTLAGSGSFGVWTVVERGGYLYVQTTDNGIQVYEMIGPTTLGLGYATYLKEDLDAITGNTGQYYGLDVTPDGSRLLLSASQGRVFELGAPVLGVVVAGSDLTLSWPLSVTAVVVQGSPNLSPPAFLDLDPQPEVVSGEVWNTTTLPMSGASGFYRLRKAP
jgi:hypothetical protein